VLNSSNTLNLYILILHRYVYRNWVTCSICPALLIALYWGTHSFMYDSLFGTFDTEKIQLLLNGGCTESVRTKNSPHRVFCRAPVPNFDSASYWFTRWNTQTDTSRIRNALSTHELRVINCHVCITQVRNIKVDLGNTELTQAVSLVIQSHRKRWTGFETAIT
jgi:hypothetical protein